MKSCKVSPRITPEAKHFYREAYPTLNFGVAWIIEAFPVLFQTILIDLKGFFRKNELSFFVAVMDRVNLDPGKAGNILREKAEDQRDIFKIVWDVDSDRLVEKLDKLFQFQLAAMETWAAMFWIRPDKEISMSDYVETLL